ncbi:MAG TPA: glycosyltransferase family 39 protein [Xanthobacteraceae bacterium]|nr:glycosyltransferase family 39 protein [Xanthobacteraceae bacterium]
MSRRTSAHARKADDFFLALLSSRGVAAFWIVYCLVHALFRLSVSRSLTLDDSRANELAQTFSLGYQTRQPPLYEWLLWCIQYFLGPGLPSHLVLRYALITALGLAAFGAARAAIKDERWAAVASLSMVASFPVGWSFHEWATQTILLCIACFATLHAALFYLEKPGLRAAAWLGLAIGFGLLAKFSYPLFLGGLILACLSLPETRGRLADPRLLLSAAIAFAVVSPYLLWLAEVHGDVITAVSEAVVQSGPYGERVLLGLMELIRSLPLFLLPWLAFMMLLAPSAFSWPPRKAPAPVLGERITLATMIFAALLAAAGIIASGATNIAERYMHPILIVAPVYVFARIARIERNGDRLRAFAGFSLLMAAVVLGIRFLAVTDNGITKRADYRALIPFEALAAALKERGMTDGTAYTPDVREAGNLRAFLPAMRVIARNSTRLLPPPRRPIDDRSCILLYPSDQAENAAKVFPIEALAPERIEVRSPPSVLGKSRTGVWWLARLDPKSAACE